MSFSEGLKGLRDRSFARDLLPFSAVLVLPKEASTGALNRLDDRYRQAMLVLGTLNVLIQFLVVLDDPKVNLVTGVPVRGSAASTNHVDFTGLHHVVWSVVGSALGVAVLRKALGCLLTRLVDDVLHRIFGFVRCILAGLKSDCEFPIRCGEG